MVGEGANMEPQEFPTFTPIALAGIGTMPDTIMDRAVFVRLRRRGPDQHVEPLRHRRHAEESVPLQRRLAAWASRHVEKLAGFYPEMPRGFVDRPADVWEPLIAIADVAGGDWPERARAAAVQLDAERRDAEPSLGVRLLTDIRRVFDGEDLGVPPLTRMPVDKLTSRALVERLVELDEAPWGDLRGKPLDARNLARRLRGFDVGLKTVRFDANTVMKGYERSDFADAWARYLTQRNDPGPAPSQPDTSVTSDTRADEGPPSGPDLMDATVTDAPADTPVAPVSSPVTDVTDNATQRRGRGGTTPIARA